ncbi:hypothetical protein BjapCC829_21825 [Bradyrhizobium barranii]|uniref:Uncharacterized protein n=1 Tax=Bradyrhizobium barranii TaxID=2992140 RepID=A0ABY3QYA8_9BRAD|nr:hypothetical protein [Bradyrhizobium japonicum]UFW91030.1 hypothetical protein BjapCC829_21825 [Bradyrhizobium japonicum]
MRSVINAAALATLVAVILLCLPYITTGHFCGVNESAAECTRGWLNGILPIYALAGAIVAALFAFGQMDAAQRQLSEMQSTAQQTNTLVEANKQLATAAEQSAAAASSANKLLTAVQRPHLRLVRVEIVSPLSRPAQYAAQLSVRATFKNAGNTPAIKAFPSFRAFHFVVGPWDEIKEFSNGIKNLPRHVPAETIFPGEEMTHEAQLPIDAAPGLRVGLFLGVGYFFEPEQERYITAATYIVETTDGRTDFSSLPAGEQIEKDLLRARSIPIRFVS